MSFNPLTLLRRHVTTLKPYKPILPFDVLSRELGREPADIIKLDANENPYGPSPRVAQRLAELPYAHIYPDPESRDLRAALAEYTGIDPDYLLVGHGADELIDLIMRLFLEPGDVVINCPPTFGMYAFDAAVNGATVLNLPRKADFALPLEEIVAKFTSTNGFDKERIKLVFVTSPNNPDGAILPDQTLRRLLDLPTIVVLDEAYIEFAGNSRITWVRDYPNLIVLRTFSKWAGLAGLRVGYGAIPLELIAHLWKIKQPYNVNLAGQVAALASLEDRDRLLATVHQLNETRDQFLPKLRQIDWLQPYPSQANFVLCRVLDRDAADVKQRLMEQGILVRYYNSPGLSDHIRISIGTPEQMDRLLTELKGLQ